MHLWDIKNKILTNFSKILSKRGGITGWNTPYISGLCWVMDWQGEEQGEKWKIDIYKSDTGKLRFPWVTWKCLVSSRTTWTHLHPKIGTSPFQENREGGKNSKSPSAHILCRYSSVERPQKQRSVNPEFPVGGDQLLAQFLTKAASSEIVAHSVLKRGSRLIIYAV